MGEAKPKLGKTEKGEDLHYSVGAIIKKKIDGDERYLLIERQKIPLGFACVAGHIDEGEDSEQALKREVKEECGLDVEKSELVLEDLHDQGVCSYGVGNHYWYVYNVDFYGSLNVGEREAKSFGWYSLAEIQKMAEEDKLEPAWKNIFQELKLF